MRVKDYVPKPFNPNNRMFECPIKDDINVSRYRVLVDQDMENNQVYLNLGYDDKVEYDSSFFLSYKDAAELGRLLTTAATAAYQGHAVLNGGKKEVEQLISDIKAHNVYSLYISPLSLYCDDPEDSFFGSMVIHIEYDLKDKIGTFNNFRIVSDNYGPKDETKYDHSAEVLKDEYKLVKVEIGVEKFKYLLKRISKKYAEYVVRNKASNNPSSKMTPKDNKDIAAMAHDIVEKIKQNPINKS